jgi:hypothetical protein
VLNVDVEEMNDINQFVELTVKEQVEQGFHFNENNLD